MEKLLLGKTSLKISMRRNWKKILRILPSWTRKNSKRRRKLLKKNY